MVLNGKSRIRGQDQVLSRISIEPVEYEETLLLTCSKRSRWSSAIILYFSFKPLIQRERGTVTLSASSSTG